MQLGVLVSLLFKLWRLSALNSQATDRRTLTVTVSVAAEHKMAERTTCHVDR